MGFFSKLFAGTVFTFQPDFSKTEYDNWLEYMHLGGTTAEWKALKKKCSWKFKKEPADAWSDKEHMRITDKYFPQLEKIKEQWSVMYNLKDFSGKRADLFIEMCLENIDLYKQMATIENAYGEDSPPSAPAFKRLAMLYEKNKLYEKAVSVCTDALLYGAYAENMKGRLARMIKKAGRTPTAEELKLIDN